MLEDFLTDLPTFTEFCQTVFASLPRSDQRHWGETYVRGLISVAGRKSVRHIAEDVAEDTGGGSVEQSLQQFVNQSPWGWEPVRRALAERLVPALAPTAWAIREAVLPKTGSDSPAVARQYAHSARRVLNCQRALGLALVGEDDSAPVNWRLLLPRGRDTDAAHRRKTRLPDSERHRPDWQHALDLVDDALAWNLPQVPLLMDVFDDREVYPLVQGLEQRRVRYLLRVPASTPAVPAGPPGRVGPSPVAPGTVLPSVAELATQSPGHGEVRLARQAGSGPRSTIHYTIAPVVLPGRGRQPASTVRTRSVLAEWSPDASRRPTALWLTDLGGAGVVRLAHLAGLHGRAVEQLERYAEESGLRHYEGRSFRGWHHHATLSALAHGYRVAQGVESRRFTDRWLRTHA